MSLSLSPFYDNHPTSSTPLRIRMYLARPRLRSVGLVRRPALPAPPYLPYLRGSRLENQLRAARPRSRACSAPRIRVPLGMHAFPVHGAIIISRPSASRRAFQGSLRVISPTPNSSPAAAAGGPRSARGCWCAREVLKAQGVVCVRVWYPIGVSYMPATSGWRKREMRCVLIVLTCCAALRREDGRRVWRADTGTFYVV
jgi:hypothetical protein